MTPPRESAFPADGRCEIHIYPASKQPWVVLPPGALAVPEYYDSSKVWPAAAKVQG